MNLWNNIFCTDLEWTHEAYKFVMYMSWYACTTSLVMGLGSWCLACGFVVVLFVFIMFLVHVYVCCVFHFYIYQLFLVYCVYSVLSIMCIPTLIKTSKKINNVFGSHQNMFGCCFWFYVDVSFEIHNVLKVRCAWCVLEVCCECCMFVCHMYYVFVSYVLFV
jgi:hypothetical protein